MQDVIDTLLVHARGVWRQRWYMLLIVWMVSIAGWLVVYKLPDQYRASARVYVDTQSILRPLLSGLTVDNSNQGAQQVALMTRTLLSRPNLEKVARMTDLDLKGQNSEQMEAVLTGLSKEITLEGTGRENLYTIAYVNNDPQLAKRVVQSLLTIFVESSLGETRRDTDSAQQFIGKQIEDYEARLVEAEEKLKEFKRRNVGVMPARGEGYYESMQAAMGALEQAQLELHEVEDRRNEIKRQLEDEELNSESLIPSSPVATAPSAVDGRIQSLQAKMDGLLFQFTDRHPDVIEIKRIIAQLEKQKQEEVKAAALKPGEKQREAVSPVYTQLKLALGEADANVASLRVRVNEHSRRVNQLKAMVDTIPKVETELGQLNRDYDVNKLNYETLLARREAAKMSEAAGQTSDEVKFKVIDPPYVPSIPSHPNRPLLMSIVLLGGVVAGIAFAFLLSQFKPSFDSRRSLTEITGLPVLGSVSMVWTPVQLRKRRIELGAFGLVGATLLIAFGGVEAVVLLDVDVMGRIKGLVGNI